MEFSNFHLILSASLLLRKGMMYTMVDVPCVCDILIKYLVATLKRVFPLGSRREFLFQRFLRKRTFMVSPLSLWVISLLLY